MIVCVPVVSDGRLAHSWGRARRVALMEVQDGAVTGWKEHDVRWDESHDAGPEGAHHARVATFVRDHDVNVVAAHHMGGGMQHMLEKLGVRVVLGVGGDAREAAVTAAGRGVG
jgi:predicted Fe-Mo cluster-binding NifX family protein